MATRTSRGRASRAATLRSERPVTAPDTGHGWHYTTKRPDMTWHDHLVMLAQVGAEIEHGLMVQYLYAAYSLGGEQVPQSAWPLVKRWQKSILAIAKEEMGHLLTVQNLLTLLGGPVNLGRQNFPWDAPYYPFPLTLEPLTLDSLSCYVYAEMPTDRTLREAALGSRMPARFTEFQYRDKEAVTKRARARAGGRDPHRVGLIYEEIIRILEDPDLIPDSDFQEETFRFQASWDDWGRGYKADPRLVDAEGNLIEPEPGKGRKRVKLPPPSAREAHVMIDRIATRSQAIAAIRALGGQGEAPHLLEDETGEPSHFDRFVEIYQEFEWIKGWKPARDVAVNPTTLQYESTGNAGHYIEDTHARHWAKLFNLRYRMLLAYLTHTFRLARLVDDDQPNVRAMVMHKVFREMYNLKTIASILVRLPRRDRSQRVGAARDGPRFAGAPFEVPYSLRLPPSEADAWRLHQELIESSLERCADILAGADVDGERYIRTLVDLDRQALRSIDRMLNGTPSASERTFT